MAGRVVLDDELPEGAEVTVIARDERTSADLDPELEAFLLAAQAECDRGEVISLQDLLLELRNAE